MVSPAEPSIATIRDITDRKSLEEQIRQQNHQLTDTTAFLNNVLESSTGYSIIASDMAGKILSWNEGARRNYGYSAEEMVGKRNSHELHTAEDIEAGRVKTLLDTALQIGKAEGEFERIGKDGQRFTGHVAVTLRRATDGAPAGFVLISKDITEQKHLEEQLSRKNQELEEQNRRVQEATRLKSEFLANMSHELRTPLNAIIGFSELMHNGKVGAVSADHKEYLGDILTSAHHLLQLINDVLDLAKVEAGKMEFSPEPVDLTRVIGEVRDILRTLTAKKRILLQSEVDPALTGVVIDSAKLKQVLYNYLSNALKFTPDGGRVMIRVLAENADTFRLEVEDTGIGILPEDMDRLFVEFQQLDASTAKKYQGTGLGLALTRRLVEAQGGQAGVRCTSGRGSVFYASLPRALAIVPELLAEPTVALPSPGAPLVLMVENETRDRAWLAATLINAGYAIETVGTGAEAIDRARARPFDAITLGLLLPDMSGWDVLREVRTESLNQRVPVIVMTLLTEKETGFGFAIQDFLVKPVQPERLLAALKQADIWSGRGPILVVDDDPSALKFAEVMLRNHGYRTICRAHGEEGLRAAAAEAPAVVLLDLFMPEIDGLEFLRRFRLTQTGRLTPVIMWTAKYLPKANRAQIRTSAQALIYKGPGSTEALLAELKALVPPPRRRTDRSDLQSRPLREVKAVAQEPGL